MPKMKSHRGAGKRFIKTAGGIKRRSSHRNHILTKKSTKTKRKLRNSKFLSKVKCIKRIARMIGAE